MYVHGLKWLRSTGWIVWEKLVECNLLYFALLIVFCFMKRFMIEVFCKEKRKGKKKCLWSVNPLPYFVRCVLCIWSIIAIPISMKSTNCAWKSMVIPYDQLSIEEYMQFLKDCILCLFVRGMLKIGKCLTFSSYIFEWDHMGAAI